MSVIEEILLARLRANAGVQVFVGSGSSARIYPLTLPQKATLPAITYQQITATLNMTYGPSFDQPLIQFSAWSSYYLEAKNLAAAIRAAINDYRDLTSSPQVISVRVESEGPDMHEPDLASPTSPQGVFHVPLGFRVWTQA